MKTFIGVLLFCGVLLFLYHNAKDILVTNNILTVETSNSNETTDNLCKDSKTLYLQEEKIENIFDFQFVKESKMYSISDEMIITDEKEFNKISNHYLNLIDKTFTANQLKGLKEILISDAENFGDQNNSNEAGECTMYGNISYILIAAYSNDNDKVLLHEICHAMQNSHSEEWNKIRNEWNNCNDYVSDYAQTNIDEDFAETGAYYLSGEKIDNFPKYKLFEQFFNNTK